jgi:hypothetical protein
VTEVDPGPKLTKEEARELRRKVFLEVSMEGIKKESDEEEEKPSRLWAILQEKKEKKAEIRRARKFEAQILGLQPEEVPDESDFEGDDEAEGPS